MRNLFITLLSFFVVLFGLSQISMMAVFMGSQSADILALLNMQNVLLIPMLILCVFGLYQHSRRFSKNWLKEFWAHIPSWLVFAFCLLNTMILTGFWAFYLVRTSHADEANWLNMTPLANCIVSTVGIVIFYALINKQRQSLSHSERSQAKVDSLPQK